MPVATFAGAVDRVGVAGHTPVAKIADRPSRLRSATASLRAFSVRS